MESMGIRDLCVKAAVLAVSKYCLKKAMAWRRSRRADVLAEYWADLVIVETRRCQPVDWR
jgi:hypothetical protein